MNEAEKRLLEFVASLIIELARTHTRITQDEVALWVARVAMGAKR